MGFLVSKNARSHRDGKLPLRTIVFFGQWQLQRAAFVRSVLITGGAGAFGTAFVKRLLDIDGRFPDRIVVLSRGEHRQAEMAREVWNNWRLRFFIGDVRDRDRLRRAMEDIEVIIHAAALKRIEVGAYNPLEVKKTNIDGAANVIEAATDAGVDRVVALSSDKAFEP